MKQSLISVIVPVYNVKEYLNTCVESILNQTYENLEVILVDDGSTDGSGEVCDSYAKTDTRVQVLHTKNGGPAAARNRGIEVSKGEYLTFIDSDDSMEPELIETLYLAQKKSGANLVSCRWRNVYEDGRIERSSGQINGSVTVGKEEALRRMLYQIDTDVCVWAKLYQRDLFKRLRFEEGKIYEDFAIMFPILEQTKKVTFLGYDGYCYLQRSAGTMRQSFHRKKMALIDYAEVMYRHISTVYPKLAEAAAYRAVRADFNIYLQIPRTAEYKEERKRVENCIKKYRKTVLRDQYAGFGTKAPLLCTLISFGLVYRLKDMKKLGKRQGQI